MCRKLEPFDIDFIEQPIPCWSIDALAHPEILLGSQLWLTNLRSQSTKFMKFAETRSGYDLYWTCRSWGYSTNVKGCSNCGGRRSEDLHT